VTFEPASTPSRQKAKAQGAFVEHGLAVQIASNKLAFGVRQTDNSSAFISALCYDYLCEGKNK
jgi:hypothetical protein